MPIPSAALIPVVRVLVYGIEATFAFVFCIMNCTTDFGFGGSKLCPWSRDSLEYDGLCSHTTMAVPHAGD
jgi:hypothetical protein